MDRATHCLERPVEARQRQRHVEILNTPLWPFAPVEKARGAADDRDIAGDEGWTGTGFFGRHCARRRLRRVKDPIAPAVLVDLEISPWLQQLKLVDLD